MTSIINKLGYYGKQALGPIVQRAGRELRKFSNRLTTLAIRQQYLFGLGARTAYTLGSMLVDLHPSDFGPQDETAFFAFAGNEKTVDTFLARHGRQRAPLEVKQFRNGESYTRLGEVVRGKTVVLCRDFKSGNINDAMIETMLAIDAAVRASAEKVVLVCPELPYIDDQTGSPNYQVDFFKLMLNLLFKASRLSELRVGNVTLNYESYLFMQDRIFSHEVAPVMIARGGSLVPEQQARSQKQLVFMAGRHYRENAAAIIEALARKHGVKGRTLECMFSQSGIDGKISCQDGISELDLNGQTVYIFQTCNTGTVNDDLMEALLMIYAARKKGAKKINLVIPYLPYNRQERKAKTREPISAKVVANALVAAAGASQIITIDPHAPATQGFVDIPQQHITAFKLISTVFKVGIRVGAISPNSVAVAPDVGRGKTAEKFSVRTFGKKAAKYAIIRKERPEAGRAEARDLIGDVRDRDAIEIDDMIDSAGTLITGMDILTENGVRRIYLAAIHGVFSDVYLKFPSARAEYQRIVDFLTRHGRTVSDYLKTDEQGFTVNALVRLQADPRISGIVVTDTIKVDARNIIDPERVRVVTVTDLLATVCKITMTTGASLEDYQSEGQK